MRPSSRRRNRRSRRRSSTRRRRHPPSRGRRCAAPPTTSSRTRSRAPRDIVVSISRNSGAAASSRSLEIRRRRESSPPQVAYGLEFAPRRLSNHLVAAASPRSGDVLKKAINGHDVAIFARPGACASRRAAELAASIESKRGLTYEVVPCGPDHDVALHAAVAGACGGAAYRGRERNSKRRSPFGLILAALDGRPRDLD